MEDEEEYADEDESDSESEYDEDDEEEAPPPKMSRELYLLFCIYWTDCWGEQAKKKPTPAKKKTATKTKPAAKPANTRDDWIAKGLTERLSTLRWKRSLRSIRNQRSGMRCWSGSSSGWSVCSLRR